MIRNFNTFTKYYCIKNFNVMFGLNLHLIINHFIRITTVIILSSKKNRLYIVFRFFSFHMNYVYEALVIKI